MNTYFLVDEYLAACNQRQDFFLRDGDRFFELPNRLAIGVSAQIRLGLCNQFRRTSLHGVAAHQCRSLGNPVGLNLFFMDYAKGQSFLST